MNLRRAAIAAALLAACAPSIKPEMKVATDQLAATRGSADVAARAASFRPVPWAEGQWILVKHTTQKGDVSVQKMSVVGREAGGYWIETESQTYRDRSLSKILFARQPASAEDAQDSLLKIVTLRDGKPDVVDFTDPTNPAARFMRAAFKSATRAMVVEMPTQFERDDVAVQAGRFRGCFKFSSTISIGPYSDAATSWTHEAVPLTGMIRAEAADGSWSTELLDYGLEGAKSAMP